MIRKYEASPGGSTHLVRVGIPTTIGNMSPRLGYRREWIVYDVDEQNKRTIGESVHWGPPFTSGAVPGWLNEMDIDVVLTVGMGRRLERLLTQQGIKVVLLVSTESPKSLVLDYLVGELPAADRVREDWRCVDDGRSLRRQVLP